MNCHRSVVVHSIPHSQLFAARRCSCAWLLSVVMWFLALIVPFIVAFCYDGWWFEKVKQTTLVAEQPRILSVEPMFASVALQPDAGRSAVNSVKRERPPAEPSRLVWARNRHPKLLHGSGGDKGPLAGDSTKLKSPNVAVSPRLALRTLCFVKPVLIASLAVCEADVSEAELCLRIAKLLSLGHETSTVSLRGGVGYAVDVSLSWGLEAVFSPKGVFHSEPRRTRGESAGVIHCEIGLEVNYELQSRPGQRFRSVAVVSEGSHAPVAGMELEGTLVLQQHTLFDAGIASRQAHLSHKTPGREPTNPRLAAQQLNLFASTTSVHWTYGPLSADNKQFEASITLKVPTQAVASEPTFFEVGVRAWVRYFVVAFPCVKIMRFLKGFLFAGRYVTTYSISTVPGKELYA
ncbi:hypothetical protein BESB_004330 [Besnoitia besnoiti]|uniref:Transmembrane protein 231 n=1 Tax=Besnoitia besnoiti TaxID=94643 RepID=A0A2A9MQ71_BESBE|nr:hypothetical protein BESB_004330 [Besnoitia besnoiti]PFH38092.1 hypothetical protein BESB_004330 [Besnoitia besnoiti]